MKSVICNTFYAINYPFFMLTERWARRFIRFTLIFQLSLGGNNYKQAEAMVVVFFAKMLKTGVMSLSKGQS
jgi:hypothetical protein